MAKDYYEILEIDKSATADEIKKSYRKLARKYHPDMNQGDKNAENKFKEISEAYAVLSDPEKRKEYDSLGHDAFTNSGHGYDFHNMNYEDMRNFKFGNGTSFEDLFGGFGDLFGSFGSSKRKSSSKSRKGEDINYSINIPFADAVKGKTYEININRKVKCPDCSGKGGAKTTCSKCGGTGISDTGRSFFQTSCEACDGTGEVFTKKCRTCGTAGLVETSERIKITIPSGVDNDTKFKISGKGNESISSSINGNLYITTKILPHSIYERNGSDLSIKVQISVFEAMFGTKITVPTPYGEISMNIPSGTQDGQKLRIKGKGMPIFKKSGNGDLYVICNVIIPKITDENDIGQLKEVMKHIQLPDRTRLLENGRI